jgi:hypothetical protein
MVSMKMGFLSVLRCHISFWKPGLLVSSFRTAPDEVGHLGCMGTNQFHNLRMIRGCGDFHSILNLTDGHVNVFLLTNHLGKEGIPHPDTAACLQVLVDLAGVFPENWEQRGIRGESCAPYALRDLLHASDDAVMIVNEMLEIPPDLLE